MVSFRRLGQALDLWRGVPGLLHRVHELVLELSREGPNLRQAGKSIALELQELGRRLESIRLDLERDRLHRAYPVTVNIMGRVVVDTLRVRQEAEWPPLNPPLMVEREHEIVGTMIGAKTVWLVPGQQDKICFGAERLIGKGALVWVFGPAVLERLTVGLDVCALCSGGFGMLSVIPRAVHVGEQIECLIAGVGPVLSLGRGRDSDG